MSSNIQPPPPMPPLPTASVSTTSVTIQSLPDVLAQLPKGTTIEAQVLHGLENGSVRLQVAAGDVAVGVDAKLPLPLPSGSTLSLRVQQNGQIGENAVLRLTAVNGKALTPALIDPTAIGRTAAQVQTQTVVGTQAAGAVTTSQMPTAGTGTAETLGATSTVGVGKPIKGFVLRGDVMQDSRGKSDLMHAGTRLTVRLTRIVMPDVSSAGKNAGVVPQGANPQGASMVSPGGSPSVGVSADDGVSVIPGQAVAKYAAIGQFNKPLGTIIPSQVAAGKQPLVGGGGTSLAAGSQGKTAQVSTPQVPMAGVTSSSAGQGGILSLTGTVVGLSAVGQPSVQTPAGMIALDVRAPLPMGTHVAFDVITGSPPLAGETAMMPGGSFASTTQANPWTTLDALWQTLGQSDPQAAARLVAALPQVGPHLLANMASIIGAVRGGDIQNLLRIVEEAKTQDKTAVRIKKLTEQLTDDVRDASQSARRPAGEWRSYPLPFYANGEIERIQMVVRRSPSSEDEEAAQQQRRQAQNDVRFLMDISLSKFGEMQLDGLVNNISKSLDLVIRTHDALPNMLPKELLGVFNNALSAVGYTGSLNFRVASQFVVPEEVIVGGEAHVPGVEV